MNVQLRKGESGDSHSVTIGALTLVFSYETCVAFAVSGEGWTVSENVWSKTTAKHITQNTPYGVERTPYDQFEKALESVLVRVSVARL